MSSRHRRRLQQQNQPDSLDQTPQEEDNENEIERARKNRNLFSVLAVENDDENEDVDEVEEAAVDQSAVPKVVKKKKKRKKKGSKNNTQQNEHEDIDETIKEINQIYGDLSVNRDTQRVESMFSDKSIFAVDYRNLNPENEMKRKFGANIVNRERRGNPHAYKARKTNLITPRDNWPRVSNIGIRMQLLETESNGNILFTFAHQESYQAVQFMFLDAVNSMDQNNIIALLNAHPYHVDSLLQLSEICLMNEDYQMATEFIERALFVYESCFHPSFNFAKGTCRLEYRRAENRPFFLALFRHVNFLGNKACYRTALEVCKVLLGLEPRDDPLCALLLIDFYAIKSEQLSFFVQLYEDLTVTRSLASLPNCAFSYSLCKFHLGEREQADKELENALLQFPSLLVELARKCGIVLDESISNHPLFDLTSYLEQSASLNQLIHLYIGRAFSLWKDAQVMNWVTETSKRILDNIACFASIIAQNKQKREELYRKSPLNVLRHVTISGIKEAIRYLPPDVRTQTTMAHDPLPPLDSITSYQRPERHSSSGSNHSLFSVFFESLMPSYNAQQQDAAQAEHNNHQRNNHRDDVQSGAALANGAQRVMDAMRELMATMTYRNDLEDGARPLEEHDHEDENENW